MLSYQKYPMLTLEMFVLISVRVYSHWLSPRSSLCGNYFCIAWSSELLYCTVTYLSNVPNLHIYIHTYMYSVPLFPHCRSRWVNLFFEVSARVQSKSSLCECPGGHPPRACMWFFFFLLYQVLASTSPLPAGWRHRPPKAGEIT